MSEQPGAAAPAPNAAPIEEHGLVTDPLPTPGDDLPETGMPGPEDLAAESGPQGKAGLTDHELAPGTPDTGAEAAIGAAPAGSEAAPGPDGDVANIPDSPGPDDLDELLKPLMAPEGGAAKIEAEPLPMEPAAADHDPLPLTPPAIAARSKARGDTVPPATRHPPPARRSGKAGMLIAALLVLAGGLGGGYWYVNQNGGPDADTGRSSGLTPTVERDDASEGGSAGDDDVALLTPPEPPVRPRKLTPPPDVEAPEPGSDSETLRGELGEIGARLAWVREYDGGDCFFARGTAAGAEEIRIEGIGNNNAEFAALERDFTGAFGFEPGIEVRPIVERQCGITRFLAGLAVDDLPTVRMELNSDQLKSGDSLQGKLSGLTKPNTVLYLIDNDGFVYQIDQFLKRDGDAGSFNIKLVELASRDPLPQVVIALTSEQPIRGAALAQPTTVATFMPKLLESIRSDDIELEYAFSFFLLGGT
ncbi:hypothetical protein [Hoeflea ulvae]|uniref:Serine/threonine protein kinase n=1 Tax=Hoeflea ulvae TaxID=2983764 RepID=A0ABT3YHA5_9HYPH|nr:hypothetical protein [Hoeflea ulvae]MCY0095174.1 hypothetical protein [Hoeflea ulvae]